MDYKKTMAWEVFLLFRKKPKQLVLVMLFDILLLAGLYIVSRSYDTAASIYPDLTQGSFISIIFLLSYFLLIALAYSFFKLILISAIFGLHKKAEYPFALLKLLFPLNIIIASAFIIILFLLGLIALGLSDLFRDTFILIALIVVLFIFYIFTNALQMILYRHRSVKGMLKNLKKFEFKKWKWLIPLNISFVLGFLLLNSLFNAITGQMAFNITAATIVGIILALLLFVYLYLVHLFNRLYLYMVIR